MSKWSAIGILFLAVLLLQACVPAKQVPDQNALLQEELEHFQMRLDESERQIESLNAELQRLQQVETNCNQKLTDLKTKNAHLQNINSKLSENVRQLNSALEKNKSVIQLQNRVIRLLDDTQKTIATSLKDEIASQDIELVGMEDTLKVVFIDKILFDSGSVEINQKGKALLLTLAESIRRQKDQNVLVEGHTDNKPLSPALRKRFPSNWELSVARAAAVVRFLQKEGRLQPQNLSARGYSFYRPVASNDTAQGRRQNRRIEIILSPSRQNP